MTAAGMTKLSVVIPFLNEERNLSRLHERLGVVAAALPGVALECVLVDDGSTDGSLGVIRAFPQGTMAVKVVKLSRNFGGHAAIAAGVQHATGDIVTFLSADLQDPPELIVELHRKWTEGFQICWATRRSRADGPLTRVTSGIYYALLRRFALPQMPPGGVDVCLVDARVIRAVGNLQERNTNVFNLLMWAGFRQCFVPFDRVEREHGTSRWTFGKRLKLFIDSMVAFSFMPIRAISAVGAVMSFVGLCYAVVIVLRLLFYGAAVTGWASLMVTVLICCGVQMLMLGVLSEYVWRALDAARMRPLYVIDEAIEVSDGRPVVEPHLQESISR